MTHKDWVLAFREIRDKLCREYTKTEEPTQQQIGAKRYAFLREAAFDPAVMAMLNAIDSEPESREAFDEAIDKAMLAIAPRIMP